MVTMKRQIICKNCVKKYSLKEGDSTGFDGEWIKIKKGVARRNIICDLCNISILEGCECCAESVGTSDVRYFEWEKDYLKF
jgi:hypothetical protein